MADNCTFDFDCPAAQLCFRQVSWAATTQTGFCDCNSWYGWTGVDCQDFSHQTYVMLLLFGLESIVALIVVVVAFAGCLSALLATIKLKGPEASRVNIVSSCTGTFSSLAATGLAALSLIGFKVIDFMTYATPGLATVSINGGNEKSSPYTYILRIFLSLSVLFTVIAALNISVLWVQIAWESEHFRRHMSHNLQSYHRRVVFAFETLFALMMAILAGLGMWNYAFLVTIPFIAGIAITFIVGRFKMISLLETTLRTAPFADAIQVANIQEPASGVITRSNPEHSAPRLHSAAWSTNSTIIRRAKRSSGCSRKSSADKARRAMISIKRVSLHVIVASCLIVASGIAYAALDLICKPAGWKEFAPPGSMALPPFVQEFAVVSLLYALVFICLYANRAIAKVVRRVIPEKKVGLQVEPQPPLAGSHATNLKTGNHPGSEDEHIQSSPESWPQAIKHADTIPPQL